MHSLPVVSAHSGRPVRSDSWREDERRERFGEPSDFDVAWSLFDQLMSRGPQIYRVWTNGELDWHRFDELTVARAFMRLAPKPAPAASPAATGLAVNVPTPILTEF